MFFRRYRRVGGVEHDQRVSQDGRGTNVRKPLPVSRDYVPRGPLGAGIGKHFGKCHLVGVPIAPLFDVGGRELPVVVGQVKTAQEPYPLFLLGQVQVDLQHLDAVIGQEPFPVVDLPVPARPNVLARTSLGNLWRSSSSGCTRTTSTSS